MPRLGYACINMELRERNIYTSRTVVLARIRNTEHLREISAANVADLDTIFDWNEQHGIRFFRITSSLFPHMDNPQSAHKYDISHVATKLAAIGDKARRFGHRITMHPGQFVQLGTPRPEVLSQSISELTAHADVLAAMGLTPNMGSVMIIHGGGVYGDKQTTLRRFGENYSKLPQAIAQYIVIENDDYQYTVSDLLPISERYSIPIVVDFFHHECNGVGEFELNNLMPRVMAVWAKRGIQPKFHWSNQRPEARKGNHHDMIDSIPPHILTHMLEYNADLMLECKFKERCMMPLLQRYYTKSVIKNRTDWTIKRDV